MDEKPMGWLHICERAKLMPDDWRDSKRVAQRLEDKTGQRMSPMVIDAERDAYWAWIRSRPTIGKGFVLPI